MRNPKSSILIFYIDGLLDDFTPREIAAMGHLLTSQTCLVISQRKSTWTNMFPTASIEEFRFNIPDISFLQGLLSRYSCRLEDLLYISDDPAFLSNSIGSFVRTIYIGRFRWLDYGKLPDMALPSVSKQSFYDRIQYLKQRKGFSTDYALAKDSHLPRQYFGCWEKKGYLPTVEILEYLADYFDVSVDYLLGRCD